MTILNHFGPSYKKGFFTTNMISRFLCSIDESEEVNHLQRPYDFTMTMLSGLAFHQNEASRYIPIYVDQYKDIFDFIPPFLCASKIPGFQIPFELDRLIGFMQNKPVEVVIFSSVKFIFQFICLPKMAPSDILNCYQ